jgi:hypothetical protein
MRGMAWLIYMCRGRGTKHDKPRKADEPKKQQKTKPQNLKNGLGVARLRLWWGLFCLVTCADERFIYTLWLYVLMVVVDARAS